MTNRGYFVNKGALWKWIQEPPNVGVQHIVHLLPHQSHRKRVQCLMLAAPWSESIGKSQKVLLVDLIEDGHHGLLDDLIFHGRDAQRALSPVSFRNVDPSGWLRLIGAAVNPAVKILKSILQSEFILSPSDTVYSWRSLPL